MNMESYASHVTTITFPIGRGTRSRTWAIGVGDRCASVTLSPIGRYLPSWQLYTPKGIVVPDLNLDELAEKIAPETVARFAYYGERAGHRVGD